MLMMLILSQTLSACAKKTCNASISNITLPDFPIAGNLVANDLEFLCSYNIDKCININNYLNKLYRFKTMYNLYKPLINN
jgi:DNA phosphorothioation-dependent restriction protein DptG